MSSSSSLSDSDDGEPMQRIKINIRPLDDVTVKGAADTSEIKASVKAWRPLGPPVHSSLSRRQSSLSSVSSIAGSTHFTAYTSNNNNNRDRAIESNSFEASKSSRNRNSYAHYGGRFGGGEGGAASIQSSPSCSSLVNEFNNRSSFSNIVPNISRTSSPLILSNLGDQSVPIAIAIQESIELVVKRHFTHETIPLEGPKFTSCRLGNIKIAFPNSFAKGSYGKPGSVLRLRLCQIENIVRFYASRLIKDLEASVTITPNTIGMESANSDSSNSSLIKHNNTSTFNSNNDNNLIDKKDTQLLDGFSSSVNENQHCLNSSTKSIELHMNSLLESLKKMYDQCPTSSYYNIDVLRYQIAPIATIKECPLQVCAYWKVDMDIIRLRIDFKHSSESGLNLERLREITFTVDFDNLIPEDVEISSTKCNNNSNNNNSSAMNMNNIIISPSVTEKSVINTARNSFKTSPSFIDNIDALYQQSSNSNIRSNGTNSFLTISRPQTINSNLVSSNLLPTFDDDLLSLKGNSEDKLIVQNEAPNSSTGTINTPILTYEPKAQWNGHNKQLTWKFDTLLSYHKTDGFGSLFAKVDSRNHQSLKVTKTSGFRVDCTPNPVNVKFLVIDSTMSKINISTNSVGFKMSLLKKEIRTARYKSEPYIVL